MLKRASLVSSGFVLFLVVSALSIHLTLPGCSSPTEADENYELSILEIYDPVTNTWTVADTSMPTPRSTAAGAVIDGKLYVVGGVDKAYSTRPVFDVLEVYDPEANTWTVLEPMPTKRWGPGAGVIDGKLYVIGGALSAREYFSTLEIYDPATDTWTTGQSMPTSRYGPAVAGIDGKLYVAGGLTWNAQTQTHEDIAVLEVYDPATNSWTTDYPMPTGRGQGSAGVIEGGFFVVGGYLSGQIVTDVLEAFYPGGNWARSFEPMPTPRGEAEAGVIDGKLYVVGGLLLSGSKTRVLEVYDPATNEWTTLRAMPTTRSEPASGVINGKFYVVGGY